MPSNDVKVTCYYCASVIWRSNMAIHKRKKHSDQRYWCWRCHEEFPDNVLLVHHVNLDSCPQSKRGSSFKYSPEITSLSKVHVEKVIAELKTRHVKPTSRLWKEFQEVFDFSNMEVYDYINFLAMPHDMYAGPAHVWESLRRTDLHRPVKTYCTGFSYAIGKDPLFPNRQASKEDFDRHKDYHRTHLACASSYCKDPDALSRTYVSMNNAAVLAKINDGALSACEKFMKDVVKDYHAGLIISSCLFDEDEDKVNKLTQDRRYNVAAPESIGKIFIYRSEVGLHIWAWEIFQKLPLRKIKAWECNPFNLIAKAKINMLVHSELFATINGVVNENQSDDNGTILPLNPAYYAYVNSIRD